MTAGIVHLDLEQPRFDELLTAACAERGVFVLDLPTRYDFDPQGLAASVRALFELDEENKLALASPTGHPHRGWRRFFDEHGRATYERVSFARYDSADDAIAAGVDRSFVDLYAHVNTWPKDGGFRARFEGFRSAMSSLCEELVRRLPTASLTAEDTSTNNASCAVSRYYGRTVDDDTLLFRDHVDLSFFTIVWQASGRPGLQAEDADGRWVDVSASEQQLIVLCGDMLRRFTNGATQNGRHRVAAPLGQHRETVLCLYAPRLQTQLEPATAEREAVTIWSLVKDSAERYMQQAATPGEVAAWAEQRPYVPDPSQTGVWRRQPPRSVQEPEAAVRPRP